MTRTLNGSLATDIANDTLNLCRCWQITKRDGTIIYLTDHSKDLVFGGQTYLSDGGFSISNLQSAENLAVDNAEFNVIFHSSIVTQADILSGAFDDASVKIWLVNYLNTANYCALPGAFLTRLKTADTDQGIFELASLSSKLNQIITRSCIPTCNADLGDTRCGVDVGPFTVTGTVDSVTNNRAFGDSTRAEADNYFNYGKLTWTSGNNNGEAFEVQIYGSSTFILTELARQDIQVGDTYSVYRGCDRRAETCQTVFNNFERFRGFPFNVPNLELYGGPQ